MAKRWQELADRLGDGELIGVEMGVHLGLMSEELLTLKPNVTLLMVDRWREVPPDHPYRAERSQVAQSTQAYMNDAIALSAKRTAKFGPRAMIMRGEADDVAALLPDDAFDFVFIDADHGYDGVLADCQRWYPKIKTGGLFCGHDWEHPEQGRVADAVRDFLPTVGIDPASVDVGGNRTWFIRKP